jgi:uracil-DNA glycosylase
MITQPPACSACPLYGIGQGFVLGSGDPLKAKYAIMLEAPGRDESIIDLKPNPHRSFLKTTEECDKEYGNRKRDYPEIENKWLRTGYPGSSPTGLVLQKWIWPKVGIHREDCFIDHTIRCFPPKGKTGNYPTGETKKGAEFHCRQYDRLSLFKPDTVIFSLHPAGLIREITPLPLAVKDFEKVRDFGAQGRRVLVLLGGKTTAAFMRYGENVTRWRGHYAELAADWANTYKEVFQWRPKNQKVKTIKRK